MAKGHKPRAGSRAFWPRKRAKRMFDSFGTHVRKESQAIPLAFAGYKAGMTTVLVADSRKGTATHGREIALPATVLAVPPLVVAGIKLYARGPYGLRDLKTFLAEKTSPALARVLTPPKQRAKPELLPGTAEVRLLVHEQPFFKKTPELFEIPLGGEAAQAFAFAVGKLGQEIAIADVFKEGEFVDVKAVNKGKGVQGPVARFHIKIRSRKDHGKRRHLGSLGPITPSKVLPGKLALPGQMGFGTRTEYSKQVLKIGTDGLTPKGGWVGFPALRGSYVVIRGSVPGPKKRLIMLRKGLRASPADKLEVTHTVLESQQ
ncbi:MAG: 50S ribosomal protein L3 [Candidatus Aenigmarchaeota archaeon]|nr:50S ribosomal protein L3 [Candidatus Aenigmarchaeota archaeon]